MFKNDYTLNVDLKRRLTSTRPTFRIGDTGVLRHRIYDNGKLYDINSITGAEITFELPNGDALTNDCTIENGLVVYTMTGIEVSQRGNTQTYLTIISGTTRVSIQPYSIFAYNPKNQNDVTYIGALQGLIEETQRLGLEIQPLIDELNEVIDNLDVVPYNDFVRIKRLNFVTYRGSTYIALRDVTGVIPTDDGVNYRLAAVKGAEGGVQSVNGSLPDINGNVVLQDLLDHERNLTENLHIEVLPSIPTDLSQSGIIITTDGANATAGLTPTLDQFEDDVREILNEFKDENMQFEQQFTQQFTQQLVEKASLSEVQRIENELTIELGKKSNTTDVTSQLNQKIDKNGNEQITYALLSQEVKLAITGGSVAVVGDDAVNTSNVVDDAVTFRKRTKLGHMVQGLCFGEDVLNFDLPLRFITIPAQTQIVCGNIRYLTTEEQTIQLGTNEDFGALMFNVKTNVFSRRIGSNFENANDNEVVVAVWSISKRQVITNLPHKVRGYDNLSYVEKIPVDRINLNSLQTRHLCFGSVNAIDFNFNENLITIPDNTNFVSGKMRYTTSSDVTVPISTNVAFASLFLNLSTGVFSVRINSNIDLIGDEFVQVAVINRSARSVSIDGPYTIDGISNLSYTTRIPANRLNANVIQVRHLCFGTIDAIDFDFTNNLITIPNNTNFVSGSMRYTTTSDVTVPISTSATFSSLFLNLTTGAFSQRINSNIESIGPEFVQVAIINRSKRTVEINGPYTINGLNPISNAVADIQSLNDVIQVHAHRGWTADGIPENTKPAFIATKNNGFSVVEFDVRFTSDNVPIIIHDATLNRTGRLVDGSAIPNTINVSDILYSDLEGYEFGSHASPKYLGEKTMTLDEALLLCRKLNLLPNMHVSLQYPTQQQMNIVYNSVKRNGMKNNCIYTTDGSVAARVLLNINPKANILISSSSRTSVEAIIQTKDDFPDANIHVSGNYSFLSGEILDLCIENDLEFSIFTGDSTTNSVNAVVRGATSVVLDNIKLLPLLRNSI